MFFGKNCLLLVFIMEKITDNTAFMMICEAIPILCLLQFLYFE